MARTSPAVQGSRVRRPPFPTGFSGFVTFNLVEDPEIPVNVFHCPVEAIEAQVVPAARHGSPVALSKSLIPDAEEHQRTTVLQGSLDFVAEPRDRQGTLCRTSRRRCRV